MTWDGETQTMAHINGGCVEFGKVTLGSDGTVEVATMLSVVKAAFALHVSGAIAATPLKCDLTITAGAVTISDAGGTANAGAIVSYILIGLL